MSNLFEEKIICSSTFRVGSRFERIEILRATLHAAFLNRMLGEEFGTRTTKKPKDGIKGRIVLACPKDCDKKKKMSDFNCDFLVNAEFDGSAWIVSNISHHSCGGAGKRQRSLKTSTKVANSDAFRNFAPTEIGSRHFQHGDPKRLKTELRLEGDASDDNCFRFGACEAILPFAIVHLRTREDGSNGNIRFGGEVRRCSCWCWC